LQQLRSVARVTLIEERRHPESGSALFSRRTHQEQGMPTTIVTNHPRSIRRIAINGHFLDEVRTQLHAEPNAKSLTYVSAPIERHQATEDEEGVTLKLPALTALQLYSEGVLPITPRKSVDLSIAGRKPAKKEQPYDANAWLAGLVPLKLHPKGDWDPAEEYCGEAGDPIEAWAEPIIKRGPRPMSEMEQILPGADPEDFDSDPILEANELKDRGQIARAKKLLEKLLIKDVRCLDAHAHLGNLAFDKDVRTALDHYQRGVLIGELSLGESFEGLLSWGMIDNRPFLRCLSGYGLCLWRLKRFEEAEAVFERLLWMSPSDNLGIRFLLPQVKAREPWTPESR
jgi:tetratricopeptide (TPR) repeat protein